MEQKCPVCPVCGRRVQFYLRHIPVCTEMIVCVVFLAAAMAGIGVYLFSALKGIQ